MDKIEVGEWIRTNSGIVDRIKDIIETQGDRKLIAFEKMNTYKSDIGLEKWLKIHSKNIIDLIEVGDYVNGREVLDIYFPRDIWDTIEIRVNDKHINFIVPDEIKSILTKEMMKSIEYRVE